MQDVMQQFAEGSSTSRSQSRRPHPVFAFSFFSILTHENMNEAAYMDGHLERFFRSLNDSGGLENTAVVLFSDHGVRFGSSREYRTRMGWYEENMPLMMIAMPESFRRRHSQMMATLHSNQHRLTTPFDVHETVRRLVDIGRPYDDRQRIDDGRRGVSLFDVTLGNRTCKDASIAPVYCECQLSQSLPVDVNSHQVRCLTCCCCHCHYHHYCCCCHCHYHHYCYCCHCHYHHYCYCCHCHYHHYCCCYCLFFRHQVP